MTDQTISCGQCGIAFCVPVGWYQHRCRSHETFWCPNGHPRAFKGQSEEEALRLERDRLKQQQAHYEDRLRAEREHREAAERRASAARGQVTKLKKRAAAGVCPCCNRQFVDLQRHMSTKHAGFLAEEVQEREGQVLQ